MTYQFKLIQGRVNGNVYKFEEIHVNFYFQGIYYLNLLVKTTYIFIPTYSKSSCQCATVLRGIFDLQDYRKVKAKNCFSY